MLSPRTNPYCLCCTDVVNARQMASTADKPVLAGHNTQTRCMSALHQCIMFGNHLDARMVDMVTMLSSNAAVTSSTLPRM